MVKRIIWKDNGIVSLKLRENLYTLGQMLGRAQMRFYNIRNSDGKWNSVDLNEIDSLFTLFIGNIVLHNLVDQKITDKFVKPSLRPMERYWISANPNFDGGYTFKGGDLIDIGTDGTIGTSQGTIIKPNLSLENDRGIIEKYQLTNMWGDIHLGARLLNYFDTGEDYDFLKLKVFPGL